MVIRTPNLSHGPEANITQGCPCQAHLDQGFYSLDVFVAGAGPLDQLDWRSNLMDIQGGVGRFQVLLRHRQHDLG